jgi:hypothetical protein
MFLNPLSVFVSCFMLILVLLIFISDWIFINWGHMWNRHKDEN